MASLDHLSKLSESVAHVRLYKRKSWRKPTLAQFDIDDWIVGHMPISRSSVEAWKSEQIGTVPVSYDELQGY